MKYFNKRKNEKKTNHTHAAKIIITIPLNPNRITYIHIHTHTHISVVVESTKKKEFRNRRLFWRIMSKWNTTLETMKTMENMVKCLIDTHSDSLVNLDSIGSINFLFRITIVSEFKLKSIDFSGFSLFLLISSCDIVFFFFFLFFE